jgi:hypothetical protein
VTDLAKLVVKLEAETSRYVAELEKANRKLNSFEKSATRAVDKVKGALAGLAAGVTVGALTAFVKQSLDATDRLRDLAEQSGITVEQLSRLGFAAAQSGSDLPTLTAGLRALSKQAAEAARGSDSAAAAFAALGVSVTDSTGAIKSADALLVEIADAVSQYEDGVAKAAIAQQLFGKSGAELIPLLNSGSEGIAELTAKADRLGITVSTQTADAVSEFNDRLDALKAQAAQVGTKIGLAFIPTLSRLVDAFSNSAGGADALRAVSGSLAAALKVVATVGFGVVTVFERLGNGLGALAAAAVAVAQREFGRAASIIREANADESKALADGLDFVKKLWSEAGTSVEATAKKTDAAVKRSLVFGGAGAGGASGRGGADKGPTFDLDELFAEQTEYFDKLDALTQTSTERSLANFERQRAALEQLWVAGRIGVETYNARLSEALDDVLTEVEVKSKRVAEPLTEAVEKVSTFADQAARNTVDIIADSLRNGFEGGAKGVLQAVGRMLADITAQIVAADLGRRLFGDLATGGGTGGNGIVGSILGGIGSFFGFGGGRDAGGRGLPGMAYAIGTGAQPEVFVPDTAGEFYPAGALAGVNVTQYFTIQAPQGTVSRQTEMQIGAAAARGLSTAARRNS